MFHKTGQKYAPASRRHAIDLVNAPARVVALTLACAVASTPAITNAQILDDSTYSGGKSRVNNSSKLVSLSEAVTSASCRLAGEINVERAAHDLEVARHDFDVILAALENGAPLLGIPTAETTGRNLRAIKTLSDAWLPVSEATGKMLSGDASQENMAIVEQSYAPVTEAATVLATEISGHYSDPLELLQRDAITLSFISREHALLSRMERQLCGIAAGSDSLGTVDTLNETVNMFDRTLIALRDGFPDAGIDAPPNDAIKNTLVETYAVWTEEKEALHDVLAGGEVNAEVIAKFTELEDSISHGIDNATTLYLVSSPGQEGVYRVPLRAYASEVLAGWLTDPALVEAIKGQNAEHAGLAQEQIDALDQTWRAEAKAGEGEMTARLLGHPVSEWLSGMQFETAGFVTEVFAMDNLGLNVAQSVLTSDYWQGDEAKWKQTYGNGGGDIHISEIEFDDSTGYYQSQVSMPVTDPATGELIGAITFGINVQSLM